MKQGFIHATTSRSIVNGPGERFVVHFQGCTLQCPGCFNPKTHAMEAGTSMTVSEIIAQIPSDISGVTISGGEPFLQPAFLSKLVSALHALHYSIVIFSGFYRKEIEKIAHNSEILSSVDALIDGWFDETAMANLGLQGSNNQTIHLLSDRYREEEFSLRSTEIWLDPEGNVQITGFPTLSLLNQLKS